MEANIIFKVFRSFYPRYNNVFDNTIPLKVSLLTELEHFHNLIVLILIYDIELTLSLMKQNISFQDDDDYNDKIVNLKYEMSLLTKSLSGGIRVSLSRNRLQLINRLYVGFDTEYKTVDSITNSLLCYTTASLSETIIKIRDDSVDFSIKDGVVFQPKTAGMIITGVKLLRYLRQKNDSSLDDLKDLLIQDSSVECLVLKNNDMIFRLKTFDIEGIRESYVDLSKNPSFFSFRCLMDEILNQQEEEVDQNKKFLLLLQSLNLKPTVRNECTLIAHFTTADVSLFHDFGEIKTKFTVLSKSFLTLDKFLTYRG